jgi:hypothetical protein
VQNYANIRTVPNVKPFEIQNLLPYFCSVNPITRLSIIAFVLFAFVGNIGVRVFTHSCAEDGIFRSYFIENRSHCKDKKVHETLPPCCQKSAGTSCGVTVKENCCTDEVDVFKVTLDFFSWDKVDLELAEIQENRRIVLFQTNSQSAEVSIHSNVDPPPKPSGKDLLTHLCTYRI